MAAVGTLADADGVGPGVALGVALGVTLGLALFVGVTAEEGVPLPRNRKTNTTIRTTKSTALVAISATIRA